MENITLGNLNNWLALGVSITSSIIFFYKLIQRLIKKGQEKQLEQFKKELATQLAPFNERMDKIDRDRKEQHEETMQLIAKVRKENDMGIIDALISRIDAFDMLCRTDINFDIIQLHQYDNIFIDIQKWNDYHIKYPELNGKLDVAIENIKEHYKKAKF